MSTVVASVQNTAPPRVQVTADGIDTAQADDLLINGGFETDATTGWTGNPAVGASYVWGPASDEDYLLPIEGSHYLNVFMTGTTQGIFDSQSFAAPSSGTVLEVSGGVAGSHLWTANGANETAPAQNVTMTVTAKDANGAAIAGSSVADNVAATWGWQTLDAVLTIPDGAATVTVDFATAGALVNSNVVLDSIAAIPASPASSVTLYRLVDGTRSPVRGAVDREPSAGVLVIVDQEAPFGVPVSYVLTQETSDGQVVETVSNTVELEAASPWISHPITGDGVALTVVDWPELSYGARQQVIQVAGRRTPVVISDVRVAASSTLTLLTRSRSDLLDLRDLLANGDTVLLRPVCDAVEGDYLAVGDVTETRVKPTSKQFDPRPAGSDWRRLVACEVQAVDAPDTTIPAVGDTLADLADYVPTTLADLATAFGPGATLLTIAQTPLASATGGG